MSTVVMHNVVSVDGYIADDNDDVGPLFEWYFNGDHQLTPGDMDEPSPGGLRVSKASYDYIRPTWDAIGSMVIGRHLFDHTNGWEGRPPAGEHVVVLTHRVPTDWAHYGTAPFTFVTRGVEAAVAPAGELAGDADVSVTAGDVGGQALAAGLVDEVEISLAPVVLGRGKRFFGEDAPELVLEDPYLVVPGRRVTHLRYRVRAG